MEQTGEYKEIVTIDVGVNGGLAYQKSDGTILLKKITNDYVQNSDILFSAVGNQTLENISIYVEHQSLRKPDILSGRWFNIHKLCIDYNMWLNIAMCLGGEPQSLKPQEWQSIFFVKGTTYKDKKKRLKEIAKKLYPKEKVTLWNCDALLMLYYKNKVKDGTKIRRTRRLN